MATTAADTQSFSQTGILSGHVHGGQQPVAFATVQIWSVGTSGYGSQGTLFATTTSLNDGFGSFSFSKQANTDTPYTNTGSTWACPATGNPYMYMLVTGGNSSGDGVSTNTNSAIGFVLGLGLCSSITSSSFYFINEITTVGTMAALTQYFSPVTMTIGSPSSTLGTQGLANAFSVIPNLVNITTGVQQGRLSHTYLYTLPESTKLITIADILAACINTTLPTSTNCTKLFTNAYPPTPANTSQPSSTFATATNVLQALWYMFANPSDGSTTRSSNLYGLASSTSPFQPTLSYQPYDWNIGVTLYSIPGAGACGTSSTGTIYNPFNVITDNQGNLVLTNTASTSSGWFSFYPSANLRACSVGGPTTETRQTVFDTRGIAFRTVDTSTYISSYGPVGGTAYSATWSTTESPYNIAPDGSGNIFYSSKTSGKIYEIPSATIAAIAANGTQEPTTASTLVATLPGSAISNSMIADASGNIWIAATDNELYELKASSSYALTAASILGLSYGVDSQLALNSSGQVLSLSVSGGVYSIAHVVPNGSSASYTVTYTSAPSTSNGLAVDGASNILAAEEASYSVNGVNTGFLEYYTNSGSSLAGAYGFTKPANSSEYSSSLVQNVTVMGTSNSVAVDISGNVYTVNSFENMFNTTDGEQYTVTQLVGAAVPVVPTVVGLQNNTVGTMP